MEIIENSTRDLGFFLLLFVCYLAILKDGLLVAVWAKMERQGIYVKLLPLWHYSSEEIMIIF